MKFTFLLIFAVLLNARATTFAQYVSLSVKDSPAKEVFKKLTTQTGYAIVCDYKVLQTIKPITLNVKNVKLTEALDLCIKGQPVSYKINDNTVVFNFSINTEKAPIQISGKVRDENNEPLPNVSIKVKNTSSMAISDNYGNYKITVQNPGSILVFSYLGFATQEIVVSNTAILNVTLIEQKTSLEQVVVVGYATVTRKDLTGAVGQVKMADFEQAPVKSFDEALAGRVAGVQVTGNDGQPGSINNVIIRGTGSVTQDNSPLYVVDGFPLEDADNNSINPADVESIDVLKDASATAIYGARGANGVIIITTKRGKKAEPVINYNAYYGLQENIKTIPLMSPYEFVKYQLEFIPDVATEAYLKDGKTLESYRNVKGIDLQDYIYRVAPMQTHNISLRGGTDKTQYSISGSMLKQDGIILNSGFGRYQGRFTLDQKVNTKLKIGANLSYSKSNYFGSIAAEPSTRSSASTNLLYAIWGYRPTSGGSSTDDESLLDELFDPGFEGSLISDYRVNPVISTQNELRRSTNNSFTGNGYFEYSITPQLMLKVTGGITNVTSLSESFFNSLTSRGNKQNTTSGVNGAVYNSQFNTWLNENTLTYRKTFNKRHNVSLLGGYTMQGNTSGRYGFSALQVPNESLGIDGLDQSLFLTPLSLSSRWTLASFLGRVNYNYRSKYLVTASFRSDGSSKFAKGRRWGYFPSGSVAWRMSAEPFMAKLKFVSDAKLRISYGQTGNNRVRDFDYLSQITLPASVNYSYNGSSAQSGAIIASYGNPDLKWETTKQFNIGYDLGFFKQRIDLSVDLYRKTTENLLLNALLPYTTGVLSALKNIGSMQNEGLEIGLNTVNIKNKNFTWNTNFNISFNRNKVLSLTEGQNSMTSIVPVDLQLNSLPAYIAVIGQPVSQMYGLIWDGVYQYEDFDVTPQGGYILKDNITTNGLARANIFPGQIKYRDINGDLVVNAKDFTAIGRAFPIHTGGFSNNFTYKNFDLNIFLQWSYGNDIINTNRLLFEGNGKGVRYLNQYASYQDRWQPDNPSNTLFAAKGQGPLNYSSRIVEDGSYLSLKTVSIGYKLPVKILSKLKIKDLRIYASGQNLYNWTNYSGPDPDVSVRNSALTPGFDFSAYPRARTIVFGINTSF